MGRRFSEKPKTVLATPGLIREFVEMEPAPHDRPLSERRMMVYERILRNGEFRPVTWASVVCIETASTYRVNGKHTSLLLSKQNPIPEFYVTVERWECDTLSDVGSLYNAFDSSLGNRTSKDINAAFAATIPQLRDVPMKLIDLTVVAAAFHKWSDAERPRVPPAERAEELLDNFDFTTWMRDHVFETVSFGTNSSSRPLLRGPVTSAMMATYRKAPRVSAEFWKAVMLESAPNRDDPTRILARFLIRASIANSRGGPKNPEKQAVGQREMYVKCIRAWNAYRSGEPTTLQYRAKDPLPEISK